MIAGAGSVVFGLLSAAIWGAGDFCGGLATRRAGAYAVVIGSQSGGTRLLVGLALGLREPFPPAGAWLWGALAGLAGAVGLLALYQALASGRMGVAAPLSAVFAAALPVAAAAVVDGLPGALTLAGFALALGGVWLLSRPEGAARFQPRDLGLPLLAGAGFGLFFVFIDQAGQAATFWPLVASRSASLTLMLSLTLLARQAPLPARPAAASSARMPVHHACRSRLPSSRAA